MIDKAKFNQDYGKVLAYRDELKFLVSLEDCYDAKDLYDRALDRAKFLRDATRKIVNESLNNDSLNDLFKGEK